MRMNDDDKFVGGGERIAKARNGIEVKGVVDLSGIFFRLWGDFCWSPVPVHNVMGR